MPQFTALPNRDAALNDLRQGATVEDIIKTYGCSSRTARRWAKIIEDEKSGKPAKTTTKVPAPGGGQQQPGGELGTVTQIKPGTIIFTFGQEVIPLSYFTLYDAYQYYKDIQREHQIEDDFCSVIKDSVKYVWERLNHNKAEREKVSVAVKEE